MTGYINGLFSSNSLKVERKTVVNKRWFIALFCFIISLAVPVAASYTTKREEDSMTTTLRLMTANIWGDYFDNPVAMRETQFIEAFSKYQPDVIGMQECTINWHKSNLFKVLQEDYYIVSNFEGVDLNYVPLFFKKARFELLESNFHYYTQTPDKSKAYTYAVLKCIENNQVFAVCNTHFWWKSGPDHDAIRMVNAKELVECMKALQAKYDCPVFAFGDLNCGAYAGVFQYFNEHDVIRLRDVAAVFNKKSSHHGDPKLGEDGQYHGRQPKNPEVKSLDHVIGLRTGLPYAVMNYQVILDQGVLDASDHSPVYADIVLNRTPKSGQIDM